MKSMYIPHGGGPIPLLNGEGHEEMVEFLKNSANQLGTPDAVIVFSAHWEEQEVTITSGRSPELIYDYYGFPPESYKITYPSPGAPELAESVSAMLSEAGIENRLDDSHGFDHGMFVPLKLMFPKADIPCIQVSLVKGLDPATHMKLGRAFKKNKKNNVLLLGSGMSFHNMQEFFGGSADSDKKAQEFDAWLHETCTSDLIEQQDREKRLLEWEGAPSSRFCHPREEHLIPLHICFGAAENHKAESVFSGTVLGKKVSAFLWE